MEKSSHLQVLSVVLDNLLGKDRLSGLVIDMDGFAYDEKSGQSYSLNDTGAAAVQLLRETRDIGRTVESLVERYGVSEEVVRGEVEAFVRQLAWYLA